MCIYICRYVCIYIEDTQERDPFGNPDAREEASPTQKQVCPPLARRAAGPLRTGTVAAQDLTIGARHPQKKDRKDG